MRQIFTASTTTILLILFSYCVASFYLQNNGWKDMGFYSLPKAHWECTMFDFRPKHGGCKQYTLKD